MNVTQLPYVLCHKYHILWAFVTQIGIIHLDNYFA